MSMAISVKANAGVAGVMPELKPATTHAGSSRMSMAISVKANAGAAGVMPELKPAIHTTGVASPWREPS
jgi:hypothetical protein